MKTIDVEGIPDQIAQALARFVRAYREHLTRTSAPHHEERPKALPLWPGTVLGHLTRDDIYDHI